uniref:Uncharacterized protein n=1 Tax=Cacopsylla melanoneura TaxID=428564 RepID=A0A8D8LVP1_9HEMI
METGRCCFLRTTIIISVSFFTQEDALKTFLSPLTRELPVFGVEILVIPIIIIVVIRISVVRIIISEEREEERYQNDDDDKQTDHHEQLFLSCFSLIFFSNDQFSSSGGHLVFSRRNMELNIVDEFTLILHEHGHVHEHVV